MKINKDGSIRTTAAFREVLVMSAVLKSFQDFSDPTNRGSLWTPESMPKIVASIVLIAALSNGVRDKYIPSMQEHGIALYNEFLAGAMRKLVESGY